MFLSWRNCTWENGSAHIIKWHWNFDKVGVWNVNPGPNVPNRNGSAEIVYWMASENVVVLQEGWPGGKSIFNTRNGLVVLCVFWGSGRPGVVGVILEWLCSHSWYAKGHTPGWLRCDGHDAGYGKWPRSHSRMPEGRAYYGEAYLAWW